MCPGYKPSGVIFFTSVPVEISLESIILGEYAENEVRKDFTPSERIAIGRAVEEFLAGRQGQRTDIKKTKGPDLFDLEQPELRENFPEVEPGKRTTEVAAKAAGFGNRKTYEQAKSVVESGVHELVDAMDKGDVSISAAAVVAKLPSEEQKTVVGQGPEAVKDKAREIRAF